MVSSTADKDLYEQVIDTLNSIFGSHPGYRPVHAKGIMCEGTFQATADARSLTRAPHMQGKPVPVAVRFSDFSGVPSVRDGDPSASPRGLGIRFQLQDGSSTYIVAQSYNGFPARDAAEFLAFLRALASSGPDAPKPTALETLLSKHPAAKLFVEAPKPAPQSFATESFYAVDSFRFTNQEGRSRFVRYRILPAAGESHLDSSEAAKRPGNYLFDELAERLARGPVEFRIMAQLAGAGDPVEDPTQQWPGDRPLTELGKLSITKLIPDSDVVQRAIVFDPARLPDGIEPGDPLIEVRSAIYAIAGRPAPGVMPALNVAINGLGRIGRAALKIVLDKPALRLTAVNDLLGVDNLAYLLKYDTAYGRWGRDVRAQDNCLNIDGKEYPVLSEKDPAKLPWRQMGADLVFECTGVFLNREDLAKHIQAGARFVILSAPAKGEDVPTVVHAVNSSGSTPAQIISCASCTTNCITPVVEVMGRRVGIKKATMTTIHAYTATQAIVDAGSKKDFREGRAAAANLIPSSTGAAIATTRALPEYKGKFDGVAVRVPVPVGSLADIVFAAARATSVEEINRIFKEEAASERYREVLAVTEEPLVSSDIIKESRASIVDLSLTQVVDGDLVKIMSWYDNEWGYANQMIREALTLA